MINSVFADELFEQRQRALELLGLAAIGQAQPVGAAEIVARDEQQAAIVPGPATTIRYDARKDKAEEASA